MKKVSISAVIITFNEERNIERCLQSLQGVADEIVVVDSYSTDRTEEICKSFGVRFIRHRFTGHIQQKNWAILQASSPYILSLDADEALSWIRHTSWYPSKKLRLWDARKGSWGGFNPHDRYYLKRGSSKHFLRGDILHYSYYSVSEHMVQTNTFSTILARSYYERGRRVYFFSILIHPFWRFVKDFFLRVGFLDGYYGFIVSINSAHEVFLKYVKLRNIYKEERRNQRKTVCFFNTQRSWGGGEKWHFDVASFLLEQKTKALYISSRRSPLSQRLNGLGISGYYAGIGNLSFLNPVKVARIFWIFRKEKVGVLITNLSGDMKVASLAAKMAGVPRIIYRRGSAIPVRNSPINRYFFRRVLTKIMANSLETKRTILARNRALVPDSKIKVIYNGVYLPNYHEHIEPLYVPEGGEIVLGSAGRLSEEKGHVYLLEMMQYLHDNGIRFKLLLAGEGRMLQTLQKKAREFGVDHRVEFMGFVEDMPAFFRSLDIFLLSSHYEGFGYVITEAMASRKPVVAFDIKSSSEIVVDGETGYITEPNNSRDLADKIMELAADADLRKKMGINGRKRVEELFSFEKNRQEIRELLIQSNGS
jgi:glycosyltransferase involved in cell wall biosynthesis